MPIEATKTKRPVFSAILAGLTTRCPACTRGPMFTGFLKVREACSHCGEELHHHRADDAPPYFVMLVVGHVIVAGALALELAMHPPLWLHMVLWLPLTLLLSLVLLRPFKGAVVGLQWALRMHGFDPDSPEASDRSVDGAWQ
ncbi:DUF983 domain-containing protein [Afifella sp. IM 167]|uniref:DUF983 domain-containing protein n=1 Tax=Afifella sp. IM 167 TaxID=2033586 RepID=UPI001CCCEE51|nr:DUF983 domain-containing protein [Afifella sp. IM 167]MBZ8132621.1 hypothetical protein [Afifella sp. IM 167]